MKLNLALTCLNLVGAIDWISLHKTPLGTAGIETFSGNQALPLKLEEGDLCDNLSSDSFNIQRRICHRFPKIMDAIVTATKQTKLACEVRPLQI